MNSLLIHEITCHILRFMEHFDHDRKEFEPYGFTCEKWQPMRMERPDRHYEIELNYLKKGRLTYLFWGERMSIHAGSLALFWAAVPHQIVDFVDLDSYFVITLPLPWILNWNLPEKCINKILNGQILQASEMSAFIYDEYLFEQWFLDINQSSTSMHEIVLLEIKARLLRLAKNLENSRATTTPILSNQSARHVGTQDLGKIESMAKFIAQNYVEPLRLSHVAEAVGLHPDYAAYIFKKTFGITINNFIIQHRVQHAQRLLVTSNKKIIEIAFESGFNSLSRFNKSFKELCLCTPRKYRKSHQLDVYS